MLVFDAVIYNEDRHFGNFGVLRDNHTGKVIGAAPIFDNGVSLHQPSGSTPSGDRRADQLPREGAALPAAEVTTEVLRRIND